METVLLKCPICGNPVDPASLKTAWGTGGGFECPVCKKLVRYTNPYGRIVAVISLLLAVGILKLAGVHSVTGFVVGSILLWIPISLFLNRASVRIKAPTLKPWKPNPLFRPMRPIRPISPRIDRG